MITLIFSIFFIIFEESKEVEIEIFYEELSDCEKNLDKIAILFSFPFDVLTCEELN